MITESRKDPRPWDGVGITLEKSMPTATLLAASNLDWTISKRDLHFDDAQGNAHKLRDHYALIRDSDQAEIGLCGKEYQPIQNQKAFEFFEKFIERGDMRMEAIGSMKSSKGLHVWALASLNHKFELPGQDLVQSYVLLSHPHIWGHSLQIKPTAMRIVCGNSVMAALRGSEPCFKHWHNREFGDDALEQARVVVAATMKYVDAFMEKAKFLSYKLARLPQVARYVAELFQPSLLKDDVVDTTFFGKVSYKVWESIFNAPGARTKAAEGTWWGCLNGVTYAVDHKLGKGREAALAAAWLGDRATKKNQALDLAVEYAKAA